MEELLREMEESVSDTSLVDFNFDSEQSDEEIIIGQKHENLVFQEQQIEEEDLKQSIQTNEDGQLSLQIESQPIDNPEQSQNLQFQNEQYIKKIINAQEKRLDQEELKVKKNRECNLLQGAQIIKQFASLIHNSYQTVQEKKRNLIGSVGSSILSKMKKQKRYDN